MMHYRKGDNVEHEIQRENLPFEDVLTTAALKNFLWMHVKGGTKVNNVIEYAKKALESGEHRAVVWSGSGGGVVKTISCAEIMKRSLPLYQVTRMSYSTVEEHWLPQMAGLEEIVANRQIPTLHIFMSLDAIDDSVSGLQKPNTKTDFWNEPRRPGNPQVIKRKENYGTDAQRPQQQKPRKYRPKPGDRKNGDSDVASPNQQRDDNRPRPQPKGQRQRGDAANSQANSSSGPREGGAKRPPAQQRQAPMDTS